MIHGKKYEYQNFSLFRIRNRNEPRVISLLPEVLSHFPNYCPEILDIQDIYALALNKLKPHYSQEASVVLNEPVSDDVIRTKIKQAVRRVRAYPNHN